MGIGKFNFSVFFDNLIKAEIKDKNFSIDSNKIAIPIQKHTSNVKFVKETGIYNNFDGLISSKKYNITIAIKVADCVPIYIYDKENESYGLIHSGWRGTNNKIIINALDIFFNFINSSPKNIFIFIGPHIQKCCYEVDLDVAQYFTYVKKKSKQNKWFLDLSSEIKDDILKTGIPLANIQISDICTYESLDCESFRRDGEKSDRMIGVIN